MNRATSLKIQAFFISAIVFYVLFSFIHLSLDITDWSTTSRAIYAIGAVISFFKILS